MKQLARELEVSYPDAARSVMEGLEDTFTVSRLGLPPMLIVSLQSTNIIESADQALRWSATALAQAEAGFRRLRGHNQLWMLEDALQRTLKEKTV